MPAMNPSPKESSDKARRKRRSTIPPRQNSSFSLWSVLKSFVGKDLSKVPMPVNYNEPLSMLQRVTEDLDYSFLLDKAAGAGDSAAQMSLVAGFAVTFYCVQHQRVGKPFNPLLGETYECDRWDESGWRTVAEQVSHHPPILAQHAEGSAGWERHFVFHADPKLRINIMSISPKGIEHLFFKGSGNHYSWPKVHTTVHNLILGRLWLENTGDIVITNHSTGDKCYLRFFPYSKGFFSREPEHEPNLVTGVVVAGGKAKWALKGKWEEHMDRAAVLDEVPIPDEKTAHKTFDKLRLGQWASLWTRKPVMPDYEDVYHMSSMAVTLNEAEAGVAPTDSRLRPDQRAMEQGDWDLANREKQRLEEKQREKRRRRGGKEEAGGLWFAEHACEDGAGPYWRTNGAYWTAKDRQRWDHCPDIF